MKSFIFTQFLLCFLVFIASAQEFNGGLTGGLVASQLDGDHYKGYNRAGFLIGGYVNREFAEKLFFQMELRYLQKGSKKADTKTGEYYKSDLHYMELPITIRYFYYKKLDFEAGVGIAYLIKAMEDKDGTELVAAEPDFNKFDFSAILGINYAFSEKMIIGAHINYSIIPVRPYSQTYSSIMDAGQFNNLVTFSVAYKISSWK